MIKKSRENKIKTQYMISDDNRLYAVWHLRIVVLLACLGFCVFLNTMSSSFHWDDYAVIVGNPAIRNLWDLKGLFDAFNTRFLVGWTFAVNYAFSQLNVVGYHFLNVWFHVCNSVFVYVLTLQILSITLSKSSQRYLQHIWIAFGAALIFLLHPVASQPVNYIWQRSTLMMAFFYLGTLILFFEFRHKKIRWMYFLAVALCFFTMMTKENAVLLPVMLIAIDQMFFVTPQWGIDKKRIVQWGAFFVLACTVPLLLVKTDHVTLELMKPHSLTRGVSSEVMERSDYILTQVNVLATYVRLFFFPYGQSVDHDYPFVSQSGWGSFSIALIFHWVVLFLGFYFLKRNRLISLCVFWFYINVLLESFIPSRDLCVEHRIYVPMIGLCILVSWGIVKVLCRENIKNFFIVYCCLALFLGVLTVRRNHVWQDDFSLWNDAVIKAPFKARPYNNRGQIFRRTGHIDLALADFNHAIALDGNFSLAYQNRGHIFKMMNMFDKALSDYSQLIELEPKNSQAYSSRGNIYKRKGELALALDDYSKAIVLSANEAESYTNRASLYVMLKKFPEALADYDKALEINPDYVYALNNRGNVYMKMGDFSKALADYNQALMSDSQYAQAYVNRAVTYFYLKMYKESQKDVNQAEQLGEKINPQFSKQLRDALFQ